MWALKSGHVAIWVVSVRAVPSWESQHSTNFCRERRETGRLFFQRACLFPHVLGDRGREHLHPRPPPVARTRHAFLQRQKPPLVFMEILHAFNDASDNETYSEQSF